MILKVIALCGASVVEKMAIVSLVVYDIEFL